MTDDDRPLPTAELTSKNLLIQSLPQETPLFRIHSTIHSPVFFGQQLPHRFDAPKQYGVMYVGIDEHAAFRETFFHGEIDNLRIDSGKYQRLETSSISRLSVNRELRLVKAYDNGLKWNGINDRISSEVDRQYTQKWSLAYWQHRDRVDGIIFRSRHDKDRLCVALYSDRVDGIISVRSAERLLDQSFQDMLGKIIDDYQVEIVSA